MSSAKKLPREEEGGQGGHGVDRSSFDGLCGVYSSNFAGWNGVASSLAYPVPVLCQARLSLGNDPHHPVVFAGNEGFSLQDHAGHIAFQLHSKDILLCVSGALHLCGTAPWLSLIHI